MKSVLDSIKEILCELVVVAYVVIVSLAFIVPTWTQWGGRFSTTLKNEMTAIDFKSMVSSAFFDQNNYTVWEK